MTTPPNVSPVQPSSTNRRSEFNAFYDAAYSTIVAELLALTGDLDIAREVGAASFSRAWQAWPSIRSLAEPEMWVRKDAMLSAYSPPRGMRLLQRGLPPVEPVELDGEDVALVVALQQLPMAQRLPLVLNYMVQVPVPLIAQWTGNAVDVVETLIDDGFDDLVEILDWPASANTGPLPTPDEAYDWTAESLTNSADRLPLHISTPPPAVVFRRAAVTTWTERGAPLTVAAVACLGVIVALSLPSPPPEARPAAYTAPPGTEGLSALPDQPGSAVQLAATPLNSTATGPTRLPGSAPGAAGVRAGSGAPLPAAPLPASTSAPVATAAALPAAAATTTTAPASTSAPVATAAALPAATAATSTATSTTSALPTGTGTTGGATSSTTSTTTGLTTTTSPTPTTSNPTDTTEPTGTTTETTAAATGTTATTATSIDTVVATAPSGGISTTDTTPLVLIDLSTLTVVQN